MKPKSVVQSPKLSRLLFHIAIGNNYAQVIAQKLELQPSPVLRQLQEIERQGFLTHTVDSLYNKKVFRIKWAKLAEFFCKPAQQQSKGAVTFDYNLMAPAFEKLFCILSRRLMENNRFVSLTVLLKTLYSSSGMISEIVPPISTYRPADSSAIELYRFVELLKKQKQIWSNQTELVLLASFEEYGKQAHHAFARSTIYLPPPKHK